jgi:hypothetical protein
MQPRAGGRQPPVGNIRRCESETDIAADMSRMQPGAGGASPPWNASVLVRAKTCATASAFRSHGGLTGGVLVGKNCVPLARRFRSHGGLTPRRSRLRVRLPASIARFSSTTVRGTHHGGLTPRRSWERAFAHRECRFSLRTNVVQPGAAGVSQPWYADPVANALHPHGGLTPAALDCAFD